MALNINPGGVPLEFTAVVNTEDMQAAFVKELEQQEKNLQAKANAQIEQEKQTQEQISSIIGQYAKQNSDLLGNTLSGNADEIVKAIGAITDSITQQGTITQEQMESLVAILKQFPAEFQNAFNAGFIEELKNAGVSVDEFAGKLEQAVKGSSEAFENQAANFVNIWKQNAEEIVKAAQEAGLKAGESFEFKAKPIDGVESSTVYTAEQIQSLQNGLTILDQTLSLQEQIKLTGLDELELLKEKQAILDSLAQQLSAEEAKRIELLEEEKALIQYVSNRPDQPESESKPSSKAPQNLNSILGPDVGLVIKEATANMEGLDEETKKFIAELVELELQMQKVRAAQKSLEENKDSISSKQFTIASQALSAEEKQIADRTELIIKNQKEYEKSFEGLTQKQIEAQKAQQLLSETLISSGATLENMDEQTKNYINELVVLEDKLNKVHAAQAELNKSHSTGSVSKDDFIKNSQILAAEEKSISDSIKAANENQREYEKSLEQVEPKVVSLTTQLKKLKDQMARDPNNPLFSQWQKEAVQLQNQVESTNKELKSLTTDTAGVDALVAGVRGLAGGFAAATGVIGLFTDKQEEAEKVTKTVMSSLALLNGVQEISNLISKTGVVNTYLLAVAKKANIGATVTTTAATSAQAAATTSAAVAHRGLTAAMLANPAGAILLGVTALVGAYLAFRDAASEVKTSQELLKDAQKKVNEGMSEQQAKIGPYVEAIKQGNLTENERLSIYNKLNEINPQLVQGLDAKSLSYDKLTKNVNTYLDALRLQLRLEANEGAIKESIQNEQSLEDRITKQEQRIKRLKSLAKDSNNIQGVKSEFGSGLQGAGTAVKAAEQELARLKKAHAEQQGETDKLQKSGSQYVQAKTKIEIENEKRRFDSLSKLQKLEEQLAKKRQEAKAKTNTREDDIRFDREILEIEKKIEAITGKKVLTTKQIEAVENKYQKMLEKRLALLQSIEDLERRSDQSGMLNEASEIDKINQAYDQEIEKLKKVNREIANYNKQKGVKKVELIGEDQIVRINAAREREVANQISKEQAKIFLDGLNDQRGIFEQYEEAKKQIGIEKAAEMFAGQLRGFESFQQLLTAEAAKILPKMFVGLANVGELTQLKGIFDELKKLNQQKAEREKQDFLRLIQTTQSAKDKLILVEKKYNDDVEKLKKSTSGADLQSRLELLKTAKDEELKQIASNLAAQSGMYKKANADIVKFAKDRIDIEIGLLQKRLTTDTTLTAKLKEEIQKAINEWVKLKKSIDGDSTGLEKFIEGAEKIIPAFQKIAASVGILNKDLGESLQLITDIASGALDAAKSYDGFKKAKEQGDTIGQITSGLGVVGAVAGVVGLVAGIFGKAKAEREARRRELEQFNLNVFKGEVEINALYRERAREQARINKLRLEGLEDEMKILQLQKGQIESQVATVLAELQKQTAKVSVTVDQGFFAGTTFIGDKSLAGMSFDELEQLYIKGQLEGKAKELFELLQKIKSEGGDIDKMMEQAKKEAKEIFTGISSDSILDNIVTGFSQGLRSASDFAQSFEDMMKGAIINSLKFKYLEGPLKGFFEEFAKDAESNGGLEGSEIEKLKLLYNSIIEQAGEQFDNLQQIAGITAGSSTANTNTLAGQFKSMTEDTGNLLAGQFGGLRLTALDQLNVARQSLIVQQNIENNTALTVVRMNGMLDYLQKFSTGALKVHVQ